MIRTGDISLAKVPAPSKTRRVLLAFLALSAVVICTPGPDTALTVRNALLGGRARGVWTAAGVASGQAVWTVAASLGAASLLRASQPAFLGLKFAGVAYLGYLGVQALRSALSRSGPAVGGPAGARRPGRLRAYRQGLLNDLANPKMAAFFVSLLPQFVPLGAGHAAALGTFLGLGLVFCLMTFGWLVGYSVLVAGGRRLLDRPRVRRTIDAVAGVALIGFGIRLAATP
jgi:threonine/homoserine/homoserine lactone efflux protein